MTFPTNFWRQRNYRVAIIVAALALLWLLSGALSSGNEPAQESDAQVAGEPLRVKARKLHAEPYITRVLVNSRTEPNRSLQLRAELDGIIAALPVREGARVSAGEVICEMRPEDRPERLARARAALRKAELDYAGAKKLKKKGLQSDAGMAELEVALANARAELKRARLELDNLKIRAPFDGLVNSRPVEMGDFIRRGEECATLLDLDPILVVGEVSEAQVGNLLPGGPASARLQRDQLVDGRLRYVSQQADPVTRAYRVEVAVGNPESALRGGLSGRLALPTGEIQAHRIHSSLLTLDDEGHLGLRTLDRDNRVRFVKVQVEGDADTGVWVSGLPPQATIIIVGQEYVSAGDLVNPQLEPGTGKLLAPGTAAKPDPEARDRVARGDAK